MSTTRGWRVACVVLALAVGGFSQAAAQSATDRPIVVRTANELKDALDPANAGRRILVRAGTYAVDAPLTVPDGATLEGEGVMLGTDLPTGFKRGMQTRIVALPELDGDLLTLSDGASVRSLILEDVVRAKKGNAVVVKSRAPASATAAAIVECEIVNPNSAGGTVDGPTGGGVAAFTRNDGAERPPGPDVGAAVSLAMSRSIVRTTGGGRAVFAINSARKGRLDLTFSQNVFDGTLDVVGGVSRGDRVEEATIAIDSERNLYAPTGLPDVAWTIFGGSSAPSPVLNTGTSRNHVRVDSTGDRIEAPVGLRVAGGRRTRPAAEVNSDNTVDLNLSGLVLETTDADFELAGAESGGEFTPGDGNRLSVVVRDSTGSDRPSRYVDVWGPMLPENFGVGNRLEFRGTRAEFVESNTGIEAPDATFFAGGA